MKPILALTMGDPAGVGAEVCAKALCHDEIYDYCTPVVIGDVEPMRRVIKDCGLELELNVIPSPADALGRPKTADLIALNTIVDWNYGQVQANCGKAAFLYVEKAIRLAMTGEVDGVVTAPLNKEALHLAGYGQYAGHTEIFTELTGTRDSAMLLIGGGLRVIHATTHLPLRKACETLSVERELKVIELAADVLKKMGIEGTIAVAGINPHSSENGIFGSEEADVIIPAIEKAREMGIAVDGPVPPDTVFVKARGGQYPMVVAQYHDQGHIPVKLAGFVMDPATGRFTNLSGVNCTVGLPIIRTSVDHGTAFDRAGKNSASEESMLDAIETAIRLAGCTSWRS